MSASSASPCAAARFFSSSNRSRLACSAAKPLGLALLLVALVANAVLDRDQAFQLAREIVCLIFQFGKNIGEQHGAAHDGKRIVSAGDQRRRRCAADPLHGAQHLDDGFLSFGDRVLDDVDLLGELGKFRFRLRELRFARLHALAGVDQLVVQFRPFLGQRRQILAQPLCLGPARLKLLLGLVELLLRLVAGQILLGRGEPWRRTYQAGDKQRGPEPVAGGSQSIRMRHAPWPFSRSQRQRSGTAESRQLAYQSLTLGGHQAR